MWPRPWGASYPNRRSRGADKPSDMTNKLAIFLGGMILLILAADHYLLGWGLPVILGVKLVQFIEYLAFWR